VLLVAVVLAEVSAIATSIYLHRALAHRALHVHPALDVLFRTLLWMTTGQNRREWVAVHRKHHTFTDRAGDPHSPQLHSALILALYRDGRFTEAEKAAREAVRRVPGDPEFDLWCASLAARLGRRDQAIADLQEASRKNGPVGLWLRKMEDLGPLLDDPRVRALTGGG